MNKYEQKLKRGLRAFIGVILFIIIISIATASAPFGIGIFVGVIFVASGMAGSLIDWAFPASDLLL